MKKFQFSLKDVKFIRRDIITDRARSALLSSVIFTLGKQDSELYERICRETYNENIRLDVSLRNYRCDKKFICSMRAHFDLQKYGGEFTSSHGRDDTGFEKSPWNLNRHHLLGSRGFIVKRSHRYHSAARDRRKKKKPK